MKNLIQVNKQSPCCGLFYRFVDNNGNQKCNGNHNNDFKCGKTCEYVNNNIECDKYIPHRRGKMWSKKKHRYLTQKEIDSGEIGG